MRDTARRTGRWTASGGRGGESAVLTVAARPARVVGLVGRGDQARRPEAVDRGLGRGPGAWRALGGWVSGRGRIRPVIGQTFPLERAVDAYAAIEARDVIGKKLLLV
jgi:NADPH:quinone reductase